MEQEQKEEKMWPDQLVKSVRASAPTATIAYRTTRNSSLSPSVGANLVVLLEEGANGISK